MNSQRFVLISGLFLSLLVGGCAKEPPKCSDENTLSLVRQILVKKLGGAEGIADEELKANIKIDYSRATAFDENIKKISCEAKLIAGGSVELPIVYESQLNDKDEHIVSLGGISRGDLIAVGVAIGEGIRKSRETGVDSPSTVLTSTASVSAKVEAEKQSDLPRIPSEIPYAEVRKIMIDAGWQPAPMPDADVCMEGDLRCQGFPEMEGCAGSGMANCKFSWKKNAVLKKICTVGEEATFESFCD